MASIPTTPRRQDPFINPGGRRWTRPPLVVSGEGGQRLSRSVSSAG